ncbi:MAG: sulfatase-like hydrolase/transferase, partial [Xanthomonadales bacterium]|nr:sulfatase-like hydrolase/transferase [Xanthomonadales bacterium]
MNRRKFLGYLGGAGSAALFNSRPPSSRDAEGTRTIQGGLISEAAAADATQPNVLFISIDDLNDWVGALGGHPQAETPNIDALAERGMLFTNAHCAA